MKKILLPFFLLLSTFAFSQSVLDQKLDGSEKGKKLMTLFEELEKKHPVRFYFLNEWIDNINEDDLNKVENEFHHIVRTNVLGIGKMSKPTPKKDANNAIATPYFHNIIWEDNPYLKEWFIEVNNNITLK